MNALRRSGVVPALVVASGVSASAWPLGHLFDGAPWRAPLLSVCVVVALTGAVVRLVRPSLAPPAQAVALLGALTVATAPGTALAGVVPTPATLTAARGFVAAAVTTIMTSPPPAPAGAGVTFVFVAGFSVVSWIADLLAVSARRPLAAAVPLLVPFLVTVANVGAPLPWWTTAATLVSPVVLLALPRTGEAPARGGRPRRVALTVTVGAATIAVAVLTASALPHLPPRFLAGGLGRTGGLTGSVGYSPSPTLLTDLRADDPSPVLRYRTDAPVPRPLKVGVASWYGDGRWTPNRVTAHPSEAPTVFAPAELSPEATTQVRTVRVTETRLDAPHLAVPAPVVSGTVTGARWALDALTGTVVVDERPVRYSLAYVEVTDTTGGREDVDVDAALRRGDVKAADVDLAASTPLLQETAVEVAGEATTPAERATAISRWLREDPSFTYSLDVPPPRPGTDPVDAFLTHRTGYCVQFATTMILMAREFGIPARLATGFLPGTQEGDERVVRASDAHAWPELYLDGLGWVAYEATPPIRASHAPTPGVVPSPAASATTPTPSRPTGATPRDRTVTPSARPDTPAPAGPAAARSEGLSPAVRRAVSVVLTVAALVGLLFLPAGFAALRRRRRRVVADTPARRIEVTWAEVAEDLAALGVTAPPGATIRSTAAAWVEDLRAAAEGTPLDEADRARPVDALDRLVRLVEEVRYAPRVTVDDADAASAADDARTVLSHARRSVPRGIRWRARLLPPGPVRAHPGRPPAV